MSATKRELVSQVAQKLGIPQSAVAIVIQETLDTLSQALADGERLEIRNFGVFETKIRAPRIARNPRTGEEVTVPERRVAVFKPGKKLSRLVGESCETSGV